MDLPDGVKYTKFDAGIHGFSTAHNQAARWRMSATGSGSNIANLDKTAMTASVCGIACAVLGGIFFQPVMRELIAHFQKRFEGKTGYYKNKEPSRVPGCFTPGYFPVFDGFREIVYVIADSNHDHKMFGVGKLVAEEIAGSKNKLVEPFRLSQYSEGKLPPVSNSPFLWS